ncbi:uncharacterized protein PV09_04818 [Verruconis gallopava]|uniref:Zn(2)-C6 fungal-type domain-containing protein n=1 Tax=Verruconis gallopava TaxID=253628 RepID=A0A0D1YTM3_9PEZI|nr:uncharacterized protein PV09_04818 [Verruconis gallopava]KIW03987.1 hypothetical protein PV09_04818 [Verruconis gallopava]
MSDWIVYPSSAAQQPDFKDGSSTRTKRPHSKSRAGCKVCKTRRIKCDETKPSCRQCSDYGRQCSYLLMKPEGLGGLERDRRSNEPHAVRDELLEQVWENLQRCSKSRALADAAVQKAEVRTLVDHFTTCKNEWLATPIFQQLVQRHGLQLGTQAEYLLHAILAVSASHLTHLDSTARLKVLSAFYSSLSLQLFQEKLNDVQPQDVDAVFACGMIHIILVIWSTMLDATTSGDALDSFDVLLAGLKSFRSFPSFHRKFHRQTPDVPVLFHEFFIRCNIPGSAEDIRQEHLAMTEQMAERERHMRDLVGDQVFDEIYRAPFQYIVLTSNHEPSSAVVDLYLSFATQLKGLYLQALEAKEPVALLLACYWFALLAKIQQWWVTKPAIALCQRFYVHLWAALPASEQIRALLLAPAAQAAGL